MVSREHLPIDTVISDLATRSGSATDTNTDYFDEFREHIEVLAGYWQSTLVDARKIELWLDDGASLVVSSELLKSFTLFTLMQSGHAHVHEHGIE